MIRRLHEAPPRVVAVLLLAFGACTSESTDDTALATTDQAVESGDASDLDLDELLRPGEVDVPLPDAEVLGPESEGPRGPAQPPDPAFAERLQAFTHALEAHETAWRAQGKTDDEIEELGGELRLKIVGARP